MRILFFSPYAAINVHAVPESIVANALYSRGHKISFIRCRGLYSNYCIAMSAVGLTPRAGNNEKEAVCSRCKVWENELQKEFGYDSCFIDDFITDEERDQQVRIAESTSAGEWQDLHVDGIPVGRFASYEYILNEKLNTTEIPTALWPGYLTHLSNVLITQVVAKRVLEIKRPDAVVVYNQLYGCNNAFSAVARQLKIPHYSLHAGSHLKARLSQMTIFRDMVSYANVARSTEWRQASKLPLSPAKIESASSHIRELMEARSPWVYSTKTQKVDTELLYSFFGIRQDQKILLATLGSGDERFAADLIGSLPPFKQPVFPQIKDWLEALIKWVRDRPDLFLILRVHPREFPNKRERVLSRNAAALRKFFVDLPANVRVNWPDDEFSLHDLARITRVALNNTSTAGLEMLLLGVPVVAYSASQMFAYPPEFSRCAETKEEYFVKIEEALLSRPTLNDIVAIFRWIAFRSDVFGIDISDAYDVHSPVTVSEAAPGRCDSKSHWFSFIPFLKKVEPLRPVPAEPFQDPALQKRGRFAPANAQWLSYAIEHAVNDHMLAYIEECLKSEQQDPRVERELVRKLALEFATLVGVNLDFLDEEAMPEVKCQRP